MSYQLECDVCGDSHDSESILFIERFNKLMCSCCINDVMHSLEDGFTVHEIEAEWNK